MVNITHKNFTLRTAIAQASVVVSKLETIEAITNKRVPKGDVLEMAKTAGLFAVKKTSEMIPDCHPLPIEFTKVSYQIEQLTIHINMEVHTVYKTGVEVEAMHGVSVVALTMYDMLKPIDKNITIQDIKLLEKTGGKSAKKKELTDADFFATVIAYSTDVFTNKKADTAAQEVLTFLKTQNIHQVEYIKIPLDSVRLRDCLLKEIDKNTNLIMVVGGSGAGVDDNAPETIQLVIDKELPGVMEAARHYGQLRTPYAMLSRGVAGIKNQSLIVNLPGSSNGVEDTLNALFPSLFHIFQSLKY